MTGKRRLAIIAGALGVVAAGTWFVVAAGESETSPPAASAPRPTDSTWPLLGSPGATAPVTSSAAAPTTRSTRAVPPPKKAEPFVQSFAGQPGVRPQKPLPSPTSTHYVRPNVDGCDHNYGTITQCVPWTFPAGTKDKCAWLADHGFKKLAVAGKDRQKLDTDGNKIACD